MNEIRNKKVKKNSPAIPKKCTPSRAPILDILCDKNSCSLINTPLSLRICNNYHQRPVLVCSTLTLVLCLLQKTFCT